MPKLIVKLPERVQPQERGFAVKWRFIVAELGV